MDHPRFSAQLRENGQSPSQSVKVGLCPFGNNPLIITQYLALKQHFSSVDLKALSKRSQCHCPHFRDVENEAQTGEVMLVGSRPPRSMIVYRERCAFKIKQFLSSALSAEALQIQSARYSDNISS